jgi:SAM-dependent methyltransferase
LPFADGEFDAVVCQFGVMFFSDKPRAFAEARRVLRAGGTLLFNVWDRLERNDFARCVNGALARVFPDDPPRFLERAPYAYFEREGIERDLRAGGFGGCAIEALAARSRAASARIPAVAFCQGTPLRGEIEARGAPGLATATDAATAAIAEQLGAGPVDASIEALVVVAER